MTIVVQNTDYNISYVTSVPSPKSITADDTLSTHSANRQATNRGLVILEEVPDGSNIANDGTATINCSGIALGSVGNGAVNAVNLTIQIFD